MDRLDLNLLRVLDAIYTQGTVSAAARSLGLTQPGVSIALRRLRKHFGDELFVRQGSLMAPTALGERLRDPVTRTIATIQAEIIPAGGFDALASDRLFSVGLSDLGDLAFLPDLIDQLRLRAPGVSIRSVEADPPDLLRGMAEGTIDLAIGHLAGIDTINNFEQTLFAQSFVCLARVGHPQIATVLTLENYLAAEHVVVSRDGGSQELFERRVKELGLNRRITLRSPHFMSVPLLVAQSDMIAVVPLAVARIYTHLLPLTILPVPFAVGPVELRQFWHRRAHADPAIMWLRRLVAELFVGRDPTQNPASSFWARFIDMSRAVPSALDGRQE